MDLELYRDLRDRDLRREGLLVAEGRWLVERLLASGWEVLSVVCATRFAAHFLELAAGRCPVLTADEDQLARVAGFAFHRGVLAAARRPRLASLAAWLSGRPAGSRGRHPGDLPAAHRGVQPGLHRAFLRRAGGRCVGRWVPGAVIPFPAGR